MDVGDHIKLFVSIYDHMSAQNFLIWHTCPYLAISTNLFHGNISK